MKVTRIDQQLRLEMEPWERELLAGCFFALRDTYHASLESLSPEEQQWWKGRISSSPEEQKSLETEQHFLEEVRQHWRDERLALIEKWVQTWTKNPESPDWILTLPETELLVQILNDRRLSLAARHQITDTDMDRNLFQIPDSPKFRALGEIDFLAYLQSHCLPHLPV